VLTHLLAGSPVLILILFGYLLRIGKFFNKISIDDIKKFVINVSLPALIFSSFMRMDFDLEHLAVPVMIYVYCVIALLIGKFLGSALKIKSPYFPFFISGFELGMIGYAMYMSLYGSDQLAVITFLDLGQTPFMFTVFVTVFLYQREGSQSVGATLKRLFTAPIFLSLILGTLLSVFKLTPENNAVFTLFETVVVLIGSVTVPLISISVGYGIHFDKESFSLAAFTTVTRKIILVSLALLLNEVVIPLFFPFAIMYRYAIMIMALTPSSFILTVLVKDDDVKASNYINTTLSLDSLTSLFLMILAATFYR